MTCNTSSFTDLIKHKLK